MRNKKRKKEGAIKRGREEGGVPSKAMQITSKLKLTAKLVHSVRKRKYAL